MKSIRVLSALGFGSVLFKYSEPNVVLLSKFVMQMLPQSTLIAFV